jgi:hypothetical protein
MAVRQQILIIETRGQTLRSKADGWTGEDGHEIQANRPIGDSRSLREPHTYETPMHAIGAGWRLMAPPEAYIDHEIDEQRGVVEVEKAEWWFERMMSVLP